MKLSAAILSLLSGFAVAASAGDSPPADVRAFIERRDLCDHFRGEDPYDEERRLFLERNLNEFCTGSDRQLAELKQKYLGNEHVESALSGYEENIEFGE